LAEAESPSDFKANPEFPSKCAGIDSSQMTAVTAKDRLELGQNDANLIYNSL
jgi:hypothetical protein